MIRSLSKKRKLISVGVVLFFLISIFIVRQTSSFFVNQRFEHFTQTLFQEEITSNTLHLHYTLANPKKYGIKSPPVCLGSMDPEDLKQQLNTLDSRNEKLKNFSYQKLSRENQLLYDLLQSDTSLQLSVKDDMLLQEPLGPHFGIQAQLPTLLAEYTFRTPQDVEDYLSLLSCIPDYFDSILRFENVKSRHGLFMNDLCAKGIIEQCQTFLSDPEHHFLNTTFHDRLDFLVQKQILTEKQASAYEQTHQKQLKNSVFPAYSALSSGLEALMGTGKNPGGLAHLPHGTHYYRYLIRQYTGDFRPVKEIEQDLYQHLLENHRILEELEKKNPDILTQISELSNLSPKEPTHMLDFLSTSISHEFPALKNPEYHVKYVPKIMESCTSPAFYLLPPLDTGSPNIIYLNRSALMSQPELFTTLAHEGFPGHLYQTIYFHRQPHQPLRELLGCDGYIEGWATYVESLSYDYASRYFQTAPDITEYLSRSSSNNLFLYSLLDIGIHYHGWTQQQLITILSDLGITAEETGSEIYQYILENPANYLKYSLGYLNILHLRDAATTLEGNNFQLKHFHQTILEIGPAPFPLLKKYYFFSC